MDSQPSGPVRQPYLSYRPDRLQTLAKSIPQNRFLGSINVYKYGLCIHLCNIYRTKIIFVCLSCYVTVRGGGGGGGMHRLYFLPFLQFFSLHSFLNFLCFPKEKIESRRDKGQSGQIVFVLLVFLGVADLCRRTLVMYTVSLQYTFKL